LIFVTTSLLEIPFTLTLPFMAQGTPGCKNPLNVEEERFRGEQWV